MAHLSATGLTILLAATVQGGPPDGAAMDALVSRYEAFGFCGVAMVGVGGEPVLLEGYGLADARSGRANTPDTLFEIASITKPFTAAAILRLEEQGRLGLDDPIGRHLPGVPEHSAKITVKHLLTHTSGVPGTNTKGRGEDLETAVAAFLGDGPVREPGTKWEYWNGGYALLAGVIERASGMPYADYCKQQLFDRAGMKNSGFTGCDWLDDERAAFASGRTALEHPYGTYGYQYRGMGGLVTTAGDLLRWDRALADGKVLGKAALAQHFAPVIRARGSDYAIGWFVWNRQPGGRRHQHGGSVRGFQADFRRLPDRDACIALLHNGDQRILPYIAENLECLLLGQQPRHPLPPEVARVGRAQLARCAGTYALGDLRVTIRLDGDRLVADAADAASWNELVGRKVWGASGPLILQPTGPMTLVHFAWYGASQLEFDRKKKKAANAFSLRTKRWRRVD